MNEQEYERKMMAKMDEMYDRIASEAIELEQRGEVMDSRLLEQGTDEWKMARLGHVSASNIAAVMSKGKDNSESTVRRTYKIKLVAERMTKKSQESFKNAAMEWGNEQEPFARMAYEAKTGNFVDKTGFWKHDTIQWLGVSPDGLVGDDGLIEIKCPNTTTHLEYIFDGVVPTEYRKQMQCQMWVTGRQWCDFVSYDPRMPEKNQLFVIRYERDDELIATMQQDVAKFLTEVQVIINQLEGM